MTRRANPASVSSSDEETELCKRVPPAVGQAVGVQVPHTMAAWAAVCAKSGIGPQQQADRRHETAGPCGH